MKTYRVLLLLLVVSAALALAACNAQTPAQSDPTGTAGVMDNAEAPEAPAAPAILSCYASSESAVKVTWSTVEGVYGYELWRAESPDAPEEDWFCAKSISGETEDSYTNGELTVGQTYYYKVRAYLLDQNEERICSEFSEILYTPAAVLVGEPVIDAADEISLSWQEVAGAHGYQILRSEDGSEDSFEIIKTIGSDTEPAGSTTQYTNTGLSYGQTYTYKMRAFTYAADGSTIFGAYSAPVSATVLSDTPLLTITSPEATSAYLKWTAVPGATGYQIWMADAWDGTYAIAKTVEDGKTSYTKRELTSGSTYYFKVRSSVTTDDGVTFGPYSDVVTVTVQ